MAEQTRLATLLERAPPTFVPFDNDTFIRYNVRSAVVADTLITGNKYATFGQWAERAKTLLQNPAILVVATGEIAFRPVDGNTGESATNLFVRETERNIYLGVLNYESRKIITVDISRTGLRPGNHSVKEFYSGTTSITQNTMSVTFEGPDAGIYQLDKQYFT